MSKILNPDQVEYVFEFKLGEGLNSEVYLATRRQPQSGLEQKMAIKWFKSMELSENWKFEFNQLCQFKSPYCVQVMGWDLLEGRPSLLLEYVDGLNLDKLYLRAALSEDEVDFICSQILNGILDLQSQNLIHGDLNPSNIMVDVEGRIRLIDFGLKDTKGEKLFVSPAFCAPEVLNGETLVLESDLYSLGCVREFLRGGKTDAISIQLKERREVPKFSVNHLPKSLRTKVYSHRDQLSKMRRQYTQVTSERKQRLSKEALAVRVILGFLFLISLSSSLPQNQYGRYGFVSFRSEKWAKVNLEGKAIGYTPTDILAVSSGMKNLTWEGAEGQVWYKKIEVRVGVLQIVALKKIRAQ